RLYGAYMSASSSKPEYLAKYANDGKSDTRWESESTGAGQWLMLDLGSYEQVTSVTINEAFNAVANWKLEYWAGTEWQELTAGTNLGAEKIISFEAVNTRKLRFTVIDMLAGQENASVSFTVFKVGGAPSNDSDNDGVLNDQDLCPNTKEGIVVGLTGCELFTLPANNFEIETIGETCANKGNGKIVIKAIESQSYVATINGNDYNFVQNLTIDNLGPNTYDLCISIVDKGFEQCYQVNIESGTSISGKISLVKDKATVNIENGTAPFSVMKNNEIVFQTDQKSFSLHVEHGDEIQIKSDTACEGVISESIDLYGSIKTYPNPTKGLFEIEIPISSEQVSIDIYDIHSRLLSSKVYSIHSNKVQVNISDKPQGIYFVRINTKKPMFFNVIKK
ncbi:discoidin domain-containing protein, partial [Aestuariibaculum suncheonense]